MTRKDYQRIAEHLCHMHGRIKDYPDVFNLDTFEQTVNAVGNALMEDNHRFNRDRFDTAVYGVR